MYDTARTHEPPPDSVAHALIRANAGRIALADYWLPRGIARTGGRPAVDWTPARREWPGELRELHAVCVAAALAWRRSIQAQDRALTAGATPDPALGDVSVTLACAYIAIEEHAHARIAAWEGEHKEGRA